MLSELCQCPVANLGSSATRQMDVAVDPPTEIHSMMLYKGFIWHWQHTKYDTVCVAVKHYPRSAALGAHPKNIVHGDGIPITSVAGPVGGLQIWHGAIPDRPSADRPQIDDCLTETKLKQYNYFPQIINGLLSIDNSSFTD